MGEDNQKALIQYRIERAKETLEDARSLFRQNGSPASIVNRAYYAMFYAALAMISTVGAQTKTHNGVMALFDQHFIKTKLVPKEMGQFLRRVFEMRQTGDYEVEAELTKENVLEALDYAEKFIPFIEEELTQTKK